MLRNNYYFNSILHAKRPTCRPLSLATMVAFVLMTVAIQDAASQSTPDNNHNATTATYLPPFTYRQFRPVVKQPETSPFGARQLTIKTNSIGWAMGIVNLGIEYEFAPRWSFELPAYYSCWDYFGHNTKFRVLAIQPELKYYFDPTEHFGLGVHFGALVFNCSLRGAYRYQTHSKAEPSLGGGISLTYRTRFGRSHRWGFECSIGGGVYDARYDRFPNAPCDCDPLDLSHYVDGRCICRLPDYVHKTYWGLDKLSLSLSYTFDLNSISR